MAFRPLNFEEGRIVHLPTAASVTFLKGSALADNGSGFLTNASGGQGGDVYFISDEALVSGASTGELLRCYRVDPSVRISADCDAVVSQTDVGTVCDLAGAASLNPDATADDLFYIEMIDTSTGPAETSTVVNGYFQGGVPNS